MRGGGAVSGRMENGVVLSPVTRKSTKHARTGGDVLTKERLKEKEPERRNDVVAAAAAAATTKGDSDTTSGKEGERETKERGEEKRDSH